jgi:hypothetical protein
MPRLVLIIPCSGTRAERAGAGALRYAAIQKRPEE